MLHRVVWHNFTDFSGGLAASIVRAMKEGALLMEAAGTSETSVNFY
jgi:hypothetical protein